MSLEELLRDPGGLMALEPEEVAVYLLERATDTTIQNTQHFPNFINTATQQYRVPPAVQELLTEAWQWLVNEGFVLEAPMQAGWHFISRRGKRALESGNPTAFRNARLLPRESLHPVIVEKVFGPYLRGDYETTVFAAFKEVEIAVRTAGGLPATLVGVELMRAAFNSNNGPLSDQSLPTAERESIAHLFAGAIGTYKNPNSHRRVTISAEQAAEMIIIASHLMRVVDERVASTT